MSKTVLVVGASGVIGTAATEHFCERAQDWQVVTMSRRRPTLSRTGVRQPRHLFVDVRDRIAVGQALASVPHVTHVVYAAVAEKPGLVDGWTEHNQMQTNLEMFENVLDCLAQQSSSLEHLSVLQGTKAYGSHLHPIPIPAKESASRDPHPNFYWLQEDSLRGYAKRHGWSWTIFRPQIVIGNAIGVAMNLIPVLGVYATLCRWHDRPFGFPGGATAPWEMADASICAAAFEWAAHTPMASGEIYNLTNGDVFEWRNLWPSIGELFGLGQFEDTPCSLSDWIPTQEDEWRKIARQFNLKKVRLMDIVGESHHYADHCFNYGSTIPPTPRLVSTIKIRQAGFSMCIDTASAVRNRICELINGGIIPA